MNNPLDVFKQEAPEVQKAYADVINTLIASNHLDQKTKQLLYIAMKVVTDDTNAILYHIPMAKTAGATRDEIKETIVLSITIIGLKGISKYLSQALEIYEES